MKNTKRVDIQCRTFCMEGLHNNVMNDAYDIDLTLADIRVNILKGNKIYEILDDGTKLFLNLDNYDKDNNAKDVEEVETPPTVEVEEEKVVPEAPRRIVPDKKMTDDIKDSGKVKPSKKHENNVETPSKDGKKK